MMDPDVFYHVLRHNFGLDQNLFWKSSRHGQKYLDDFVPYLSTYHEADCYWKNCMIKRAQSSPIWLYDQEAVFPFVCDRVRQRFRDFTHADKHYIVDQSTFDQVAAVWLPTTNYPIWCHSELNSRDIQQLEKSYFVPCYYWYHAIVARAWFASYNHMLSLDVRNKHSAPYRFLLYSRDMTGTRAYRAQALEQLRPWSHNIMHDWQQTQMISPDYSAKIDVEHAQAAGLHLVFETLFDTDKIHLTEKVFKPMVMSQPFILWAAPNSLATLRKYGFKTFHHVWSEDYDQETNGTKRLSMLTDLVRELASLTAAEYARVYQECLPVIEHNRSWFYSSDFEDLCWNELISNFDVACATKKELLDDYSQGQFARILEDHSSLAQIPMINAALAQIAPGHRAIM